MDLYKHFLFRRGYLITNARLDTLDHATAEYLQERYKKIDVASFYIFFDYQLDIATYRGQGTEIVILGTILDPVNNVICSNKIVQQLHSAYIQSDGIFFDYLDNLSGRFLVLVASQSRHFILQDAAGNRSAFYSRSLDRFFVSSHAQIIADINKYNVPEERKNFIQYLGAGNGRALRHFPGLLTPYGEISMLTPNTYLNINDFSVQRFFPRQEIKREKLSPLFIDELSELFTRQITLLNQKFKLSVSVTGGTDSRLTLASTKHLKDDIFYFTYRFSSFQGQDARLAQKMCNRLGLNHHLIEGKNWVLDKSEVAFLDIFHKNTAYMRASIQGLVIKKLLESLPTNSLHIKSNVSEVARARYRRSAYLAPQKEATPQILSQFYGIYPRSKFCVNGFKEFIETTHLTRDSIFNYDYFDLFLWEHRMGCWQSLAILDSDMAHDTYILYNNRTILKKMLSVDFRHRATDGLHRKLIENLWPEVLQDPINPWKKKASWFEKIIKGLKMRYLYHFG
ncbi:MAG: hypothetical protein J4F29_23505 [Candidatus Latescibacteria bacterium]|nr:hypothetical protein [Candidatus Latescibacterota bacterium]